MDEQQKKRSTFSGKLGFVLAAAGASVGLGNIWRFPYLAAKYGGGIFLLVYIILALTFGFSMIVAETALGRMTGKSPVGAFAAFGKTKWRSCGGWINAIIPVLIVPYYSVIGGWVIKYLVGYLSGHGAQLAADGYFTSFISSGVSTEVCFVIFALFTLGIIFAGVRNGIERVSKIMMPILVILSLVITVYSVTRPGAWEGVKYFLVPNFKDFSWMTVVTAMGQVFYSLSIAMGILITFGSYMKKNVSIEKSTRNVEIFDTAIAILAGLMIIPAVFAFSGGSAENLQAGPSLMFITLPKVFASMGLGTAAGILFFVLVLFAAVTSSIALTESAVSTFEDQFGWSRKKATLIVGMIMLALGTLSSLGYGPLAGVKLIGMQFLDFIDFLTNSVMMPVAAIATCLLVSRVIGVGKIEQEVLSGETTFRRKKIFNFMIRFLCPVFAVIILLSSIANAFGWISM
ncbi:MAG: sodium-dependent transporter [Oscillospiraceae bacterium]|nr:sodium-dependent transporter [Oscillospiraceae bacterium]